jgi:hypothetical protein
MRTVGTVDACEEKGVEGAPIVSMGENAVYLVNTIERRGFTRGEKGSRALLEIPETTYDPMGLEGVGITRCQGVREPQKTDSTEYIHIAHAAATESGNRGMSLSTVSTTSWQFFFYYSIFRNCGSLIRSRRAIVIGI